MTNVDVLIVGQGIAGTTLAWQLLAEGATIAVVDRNDRVTSSKIAAGLMTPITGKRLAKSWRYEEFYANAEPFYRRIEAIVVGTLRVPLSEDGTRSVPTTFFHPRRMLKLLTDEAEVRIAKEKWTGEFAGLVSEPDPPIDERQLNVTHGAMEMTHAAQLDVASYLEVSRREFVNRDILQEVNLNSPDDFRLNDDSVICDSLQIEAKFVAFCQGFLNPPNPWFAPVPFRPAKGEILTVQIPGFHERRVIHHRGLWIAPTRDTDIWKVGSTYSWDDLDNVPTDAGRLELIERLKEVLLIPFEVIDHHAAVRPIIFESKPRIGFHPEDRRLAYFNGLGSKGSLLAPTFAKILARAMIHGEPIETAVDVQSLNWNSPSPPTPLPQGERGVSKS